MGCGGGGVAAKWDGGGGRAGGRWTGEGGNRGHTCTHVHSAGVLIANY